MLIIDRTLLLRFDLNNTPTKKSRQIKEIESPYAYNRNEINELCTTHAYGPVPCRILLYTVYI